MRSPDRLPIAAASPIVGVIVNQGKRQHSVHPGAEEQFVHEIDFGDRSWWVWITDAIPLHAGNTRPLVPINVGACVFTRRKFNQTRSRALHQIINGPRNFRVVITRMLDDAFLFG